MTATPTFSDTNHDIRFVRVLSARAKDPVVHVTVDDYLVRWTPRKGWSCTCDEVEYPECPHIPAVDALLDDRVVGDA